MPTMLASLKNILRTTAHPLVVAAIVIDLDRNIATVERVVRKIDSTGATLADFLDYVVFADFFRHFSQ